MADAFIDFLEANFHEGWRGNYASPEAVIGEWITRADRVSLNDVLESLTAHLEIITDERTARKFLSNTYASFNPALSGQSALAWMTDLRNEMRSKTKCD